MGRLFDRSSTIVSGGSRFRASTSPDALSDFWYAPGWNLALEAAGVRVTPELALTLSYVYCAVDTISADLGSAPCQVYEDLGDQGRRRVKFSDPGIGGLAYRLQWQPNVVQTAKAFWSTLAWQWLLRPACYAEILYRDGSGAFVDQLVPRHPDRVQQERLPMGEVRFKLTETDGTSRYVSDDEMLCVRNTSSDGLNAISRPAYGAKALSTGLALQDFTRNYFRKGATAAILASYKGTQMGDDQEAALHRNITRYMSGVANAGGVMLSPVDIDFKELGVSPQKAELLGLKNISGRDVARMYKMPPSWLGIEGAAAYNSQVQDATNYVNRCQIPLCVEFEQAIKRDLILQRERYFAKFNLDYLLRGDLLTRMQAYQIGIQSRVLRPSEARVREDMNPDERLDRLSEMDNRPGTPANQASGQDRGSESKSRSARSELRAHLFIFDAATRCIRRERVAVEKIAKRLGEDVDGWKAELKDFYADHATFVSDTMRLPIETARAFAAQHGSMLETHGVPIMSESWERSEAEELAALALDPMEVAA